VATAPRSGHVSTAQRSESASCKWISPETCRAARRASAARPVRHGGGVGLRCLPRRPHRARGGAGARGCLVLSAEEFLRELLLRPRLPREEPPPPRASESTAPRARSPSGHARARAREGRRGRTWSGNHSSSVPASATARSGTSAYAGRRAVGAGAGAFSGAVEPLEGGAGGSGSKGDAAESNGARNLSEEVRAPHKVVVEHLHAAPPPTPRAQRARGSACPVQQLFLFLFLFPMGGRRSVPKMAPTLYASLGRGAGLG